MRRTVGKLSPARMRTAKPKHDRRALVLSDGGGLYLQCTLGEGGHVRRSWAFRYERDGRRREAGLGPTYTVGLAEARERARTMRLALLDGLDPLETKRVERDRRRLEAAKAMTFGQCVDAYLQTHDSGWGNAKHRKQWRMTLTAYCKPISDLPVKDIDTDLVLRVLTPLWATRTETAKRLRGRIERVLSWAKGRGLRDGENPARWAGHLDEMLARPSKIAPVKHHAALPYAEIPQFMAELAESDSANSAALQLTILCATRTSETIGAAWREIDLETKTWTIPANRMKGGRPHKVPLPERAVQILRALPRHGARIFGLSNTAMLELLRGMRPGTTVHGTARSSFMDWAHEQTAFPKVVIDMALAHKVGDKVEAAYRRGDLFNKRRQLMDAWAAYCAKPPASGETVVQLRRVGADALPHLRRQGRDDEGGGQAAARPSLPSRVVAGRPRRRSGRRRPFGG